MSLTNRCSVILCKGFIKFCKDYTKVSFSVLTNDATLPSSNS